MTPKTKKSKPKKPSKAPKMVRLNLRVPSETRDDLTRIKHLTKASSLSAACKGAAFIAREVLEGVEDGGTVVVRDKKGRERKIHFVVV